MSDEETITCEELAAALSDGRGAFPGHGWQRSGVELVAVADPHQAASHIFEIVQAGRKPRTPGQVAYETLIAGKPGATPWGGQHDYVHWEWERVAETVLASGTERPLRKLVPEGSLAAKLSYQAVLDELGLGMEHEEDYTQLATRIMKLLDGAE
jgi:hypothetical protein